MSQNILESKSVMAASHVEEPKEDQQGDCERCMKIDQQFDEQVKASERLKQNNEDLKIKIDELSQILQEKLEALKQKKAPQKKEKSVDPVKKELDVLHKKIFMAQKHLKLLEDKQQNNQNVQRITEMKNEITEKQMLLGKLLKENKLLEDIKIQNEAILAEREAAQEIKDLDEEAIGLRGLLKDVRKNDRIVEKEMTKQCQYLIAIEQKHKEVCEKFGISPTLNQSRFDKLQDLITENHKNRQKQQDKDEKEKQKKLGKIEINAESYQQLNDEIKKKKQEKTELDGVQKRELDDVTGKIKQIGLERDTLLLRLRDKEKELNIAIMKINELKRLTKHNALQPLVIESVRSGNRQELGNYLKMKKDYRREQKGVAVGSETACSWDNSSELPETKDYQIQSITVWFSDEQIKGLQVEYKLKNGEKVVLDGFFPKSTDNLTEKSLKLRGPEYIQSISGFYNNYFIEYLRIVSSRGNYILAGSDKNQSRCKKFEFEIKKDEKPISFFGVVDKINFKKNKDSEGPQDEDMILTSFGVELKKREAQHRLEQVSNKNNASSQNQINNQFDEDDYELYADHSKKALPKNGQNRKIIDANNSKVNSEMNDYEITNNNNNNFEDNQGEQFENSPQNGQKVPNQNKKIVNENSPANQNQKRKESIKQVNPQNSGKKVDSQPNTPQKQVKQENNNNVIKQESNLPNQELGDTPQKENSNNQKQSNPNSKIQNQEHPNQQVHQNKQDPNEQGNLNQQVSNNAQGKQQQQEINENQHIKQ